MKSKTKLSVSKEKEVVYSRWLKEHLRFAEWKRNDIRMSKRIAMPTFYIVLSTCYQNTAQDFHFLRVQGRATALNEFIVLNR